MNWVKYYCRSCFFSKYNPSFENYLIMPLRKVLFFVFLVYIIIIIYVKLSIKCHWFLYTDSWRIYMNTLAKRFGPYRYLPAFFVLGGVIELFMIKVRIGKETFCKLIKWHVLLCNIYIYIMFFLLFTRMLLFWKYWKSLSIH